MFLFQVPIWEPPWFSRSFPGSSVGKEPACKSGNPSSISGSGKPPREGISHQLQYSWASLVAQMLKNLPVMRETWVWSLPWQDPHGNPFQYSCLENSMNRGAWQATLHGVAESRTWLSDFHVPGCPEARTLHFYSRGTGSGLAREVLHAVHCAPTSPPKKLYKFQTGTLLFHTWASARVTKWPP